MAATTAMNANVLLCIKSAYPVCARHGGKRALTTNGRPPSFRVPFPVGAAVESAAMCDSGRRENPRLGGPRA